MAKKKLFKSKTNFTLKRLHQSGSYGNIYERDYTTIINSVSKPDGQIPIYNSPSFKLSVRAGLNSQKKYKYGSWMNNPILTNSTSWTLENMPKVNSTNSEIKLKPDTHKLSDFACFGSALELIRTSITNIISKFPAELYVTNKKLSETGILESGTIPLDAEIMKYKDYSIVENPMNIDILQSFIPENSKVSPLRYMCESKYLYNLINSQGMITNGKELESKNQEFYKAVLAEDKKCLINGDFIGKANFRNSGGDLAVIINVFYYEGDFIYLSRNIGYRVRPNDNVINEFFENLDDFEQVLLNQYTDYTAKFETYVEDDENGLYLTERSYKWPLANGGWNISVNGIEYTKYIDSLSKLAMMYDELDTNAIWRNMTHESICNMDLTSSNGSDISTISNSSKLKQTLNIIGRQFDEIKKYADTIKNVNTITYTQDGNTPDYFLSDNLELSGWEPKEILSNIPNNILTEPMYGSRTEGFTSNDANNEFMRRLQLNSKKIFAEKGTKKAIEDLMAIFGYHSTDWLKRYYGKLNANDLRKAYMMIEFVYVADSYSNKHNPETIATNVKQLNQLKDNYNIEDINNPYAITDEYQGLPVTEVTYDGKTRIVPWFDKNLEYDAEMYFQMKGGWGRNDGNAKTDNVTYDYSISKLRFVNKISDLYEIPYASIENDSIYYIGSTSSYLKLIDIDNHNNSKGWGTPTEDEIIQIQAITESNKSNNPHTGNYDNGNEFIMGFGELFHKSSFENARKDESDKKANFGFDITRQADSTKCLFFGDSTLIDDVYPLRGKNRILPYNFFGGGNYDETASLSVINSKELHITFDDQNRDLLENDIIPYLKQIIPSTTIFSYSFEHLTEDDNKPFDARVYKVVCDGKACPIYGVI